MRLAVTRVLLLWVLETRVLPLLAGLVAMRTGLLGCAWLWQVLPCRVLLWHVLACSVLVHRFPLGCVLLVSFSTADGPFASLLEACVLILLQRL